MEVGGSVGLRLGLLAGLAREESRGFVVVREEHNLRSPRQGVRRVLKEIYTWAGVRKIRI